MATGQGGPSGDELECRTAFWRSQAATLSQIRLALLMLRQCWLAGGSEATLAAVEAWVDEDMRRPLPWPDCPAFAAWASGHGLRRVDDRVAWPAGE